MIVSRRKLSYDHLYSDAPTVTVVTALGVYSRAHLHEGDFNDFMAFLYASNINPETLIGEGKDAVATIKAAMKGFKDNVLYWRKSKDNVNAAQLMFNNANHYGSLLSR